MLTGKHSCVHQWQINGREMKIRMENVAPLLEDREPVIVDHDEICWKFKENPMRRRDTSRDRYDKANVMIPGIIAEGAPNPCNLKYRMIDGVHRITKLKIETNYTKSKFFILTLEEFNNLLEPL